MKDKFEVITILNAGVWGFNTDTFLLTSDDIMDVYGGEKLWPKSAIIIEGKVIQYGTFTDNELKPYYGTDI